MLTASAAGVRKAKKSTKMSQTPMARNPGRKANSTEVEDAVADDIKNEDSEESYTEKERQSECPT